MWDKVIDVIIMIFGMILILCMIGGILGLFGWVAYTSPWFMIKVVVVVIMVVVIFSIPRILKW